LVTRYVYHLFGNLHSAELPNAGIVLESEDRTGEFREQLVDLAKLAPLFAHSLERFDEGE
jgi:hypothetical protein